VQVVGRSCAACGARIVTAAEGKECASCSAALHTGCAAGHVCAERDQAAAAAPPARRRWVALGAGLLGVLVASIVGPRFRSSQTKGRVAERAAAHLDCPSDQVEVKWGGQITASGCGRTVRYLRVCGQIERPECLERVEVVQP
jgi:hypothetical protein